MYIEWLLVADHAEVVNGKLYLNGGGWNRLGVVEGTEDQPRSFYVALAIRVDWNETNQRHPIVLKVVDIDGVERTRMEAEFEVGRPAGMRAGQDQRTQLALSLNMKKAVPGEISIIASAGDGGEASYPITVHSIPTVGPSRRLT